LPDQIWIGPAPSNIDEAADGEEYFAVAPDGAWRVPTVLDNLIQRKELPIMAAVFIDPGRPLHDDGLASVGVAACRVWDAQSGGLLEAQLSDLRWL
jgi:hypothetical protein